MNSKKSFTIVDGTVFETIMQRTPLEIRVLRSHNLLQRCYGPVIFFGSIRNAKRNVRACLKNFCRNSSVIFHTESYDLTEISRSLLANFRFNKFPIPLARACLKLDTNYYY